MFFDKPKTIVVSTDGIDTYQRSADQVTAANEFIDETIQELELAGIHPWHASDTIHLQFALATIAFSNDRTAELLLEEGVVEEKRGGRSITPDMAAFGLGLSQGAINQLNAALRIVPNTDEALFDEETLTNLQPENMVPYWPKAKQAGATEAWQDENGANVTLKFIQAIINAAYEFQVHAHANVRLLQTSCVTVPPEFASMVEIIDGLLSAAQLELDTANNILDGIIDNESSEEVIVDLYRRAHDGYIQMMYALMSARTPQMLGQEFFPIRKSNS